MEEELYVSSSSNSDEIEDEGNQELEKTLVYSSVKKSKNKNISYAAVNSSQGRERARPRRLL